METSSNVDSENNTQKQQQRNTVPVCSLNTTRTIRVTLTSAFGQTAWTRKSPQSDPKANNVSSAWHSAALCGTLMPHRSHLSYANRWTANGNTAHGVCQSPSSSQKSLAGGHRFVVQTASLRAVRPKGPLGTDYSPPFDLIVPCLSSKRAIFGETVSGRKLHQKCNIICPAQCRYIGFWWSQCCARILVVTMLR